MAASETGGIGFLLADVSRLLRRDFDRRVRALALTQVQWRAIMQLHRDPGIRQAVLAERLEVTPITVARLIDRLGSAGWVRREADPSDRRAALLFLTPKAGPILADMRAHASEALECAMAGIAQVERRRLTALLEQIKQNLAEDKSASAGESNAGRNDDGRTRKRKHARR